MSIHGKAERVVILAAIDQTSSSGWAIDTATAIAATVGGAELHLVHVLRAPAFPTRPTLQPSPVEHALAFIGAVKGHAAEVFRGPISGHLATGYPHEQILALAADLDADLIVIGSHGERHLRRSLSERIATDAACPVLVARAKWHPSSVPEIDPPCPRCVEAQRRTQGRELWCTGHATRHAHGRLHYSLPPSFGGGSMFIRPEG